MSAEETAPDGDLTPGVHHAFPEHTYHAHPALGSTSLKHLLISPATYRWWADNPTPPKDSYDLGSVAHALILGVGKYAVSPHATYHSAPAKKWKADQYAAGITPIRQDDHDDAQRMAEAVLDHPEAGGILAATTAREVSMLADLPTGPDGIPVACKARIDALLPTAEIDIKTTSAQLTPYALAKTLHDYGYHVQGGGYRLVMQAVGLPAVDRLIVWVTKKPPHLVAVTRITDRAIERGIERATRARELWLHCTLSGQWPGPMPGITDLDLPEYAYRNNSEDLE